jgi:8-oxo-dGTP diphosphatase
MSGGSVVTAIIRRDDALLMVRQQGMDDDEATWFVPGGRVEPGELLHEALVREVREETGLEIDAPAHLGWISQHALDHPTWGGVWTAFGFEVADPGGEPAAQDPDRIVSQAAFVPLGEAMQLLAQVPQAPMRDPVVGYLDGTAKIGSLWIWRVGHDEADTPLLTLPTALHMTANIAD